MQVLSGATCHRIQHEQGFAETESATLGGSEQGRSDASTAHSPMHEHLRNVCAMRLILRLV